MSKIQLKPSAQSLTDYLHLFVLVGFAFAQPVYDILGQNAEFFVAHQAGPVLIITLVLFLSVGLPLFFVLVELVARIFSRRSRRVVHRALVLVLIVLIVAPLAKQLAGDNNLIMIGLVLAVASLFTVIYVRLNSMRMFMTVLLPVIFIFPLWFVWGTPVARLVIPQTMEMRADVQIENPVPLVLVVFDEFSTTSLLDSDGRIDPVRFPNFMALAANSWWFPNAVAASQSTAEAIPSILTGRNPRPKDRLTPTATDYPDNLFTMLAGKYSFNVSETMTTLSPNSMAVNRYAALFSDIAVIYLHLVLPPKMGDMLPMLDARWTGFGQDLIGVPSTLKEGANPPLLHTKSTQKVEQQVQFLSNIKVSPSPGLYFIHTLMPHIPYHYLASGYAYSREQKLPEGIISDRANWLGEESLIITAYHRYLQQVGYIDTFLGKLKNQLISAGIYDKSLVIITADHGVAFQPLLSRRHISDGNASEILKIPMFVKLPGQKEAHVDERIVSSTDVLPTIIDVLGAKVPWKFDGYSMFSDQQPLRTGIDFIGVGHFDADDIVGFPRLEWQVENYGERTPLNQLIPKGPYHELAGRHINDLRIGKMENIALKSNDIGNFQQVNMESHFLPSLFKGYIDGSDDQKLPLAITVNGKIWATTYTSEWDGQKNYFSVLLPSDAFNQGRNIVKGYLIDQFEDEFLLRPLKEDHPDIKLRRKQSVTETLILANGREILVETRRKNMDAYLDWLTLQESMLVFEGWAVDLVESQPASNVLIFKGKKLVWKAAPTYKREGVAEVFNRPTLLRSGYRAIVPLSILESHSGDISVIAISKDKRAFRLHIKDAHKELIRATLAK